MPLIQLISTRHKSDTQNEWTEKEKINLYLKREVDVWYRPHPTLNKKNKTT